MMHMRTGICLSVLVFLLSVTTDIAEENDQAVYFRSDGGIAGDGRGSIPVNLNSPDLLLWRTPLDSGHSSPIMCGGRIFLTTFDRSKEELATLALDAGTGKALWKKIAPALQIEEYNYDTGNAAQATPACDGRRLYVFFGSCGLICYDLDGNRLWERRMGPFQDEYGSASSPVLVDGKVIVQQDHDIGSFLMALDGETGKVLWKTERPDAVRSYSTPAVWTRNGRKELLAAGALELAGYDPSDGRRLWRVGGPARVVIPAPVPSGETVYMSSWSPGSDGMRRSRIETWAEALRSGDRNGDGRLSLYEVSNPEVMQRFVRIDTDRSGDLQKEEWERQAAVFAGARNGTFAVRPDGGEGELPAGAVAWEQSRGAPFVTTPLLSRGILWLVKDGGIVTKLSAESGRVLGENRLPAIGNYYASPVAADGRVLVASEQGAATILEDKPEWAVVSTRNFGEKIYATPLFAPGRLFIRTEKAIYCFGKNK